MMDLVHCINDHSPQSCCCFNLRTLHFVFAQNLLILNLTWMLIHVLFCSSDCKLTGKLTVKEHFVYTDAEGILYHFLVEGNVFTDASKIPPEVRV